MKDIFDNFLVTVYRIATVAGIFLLGVSIGYDVGCSSKHHHTSSYNAHGELTCKICKKLLEKGKTNEHK